MTYSTAEEERLARLIPDTEAKMRAIGDAMEARGTPVYVGQTRRSPEEQAAAVASGHSSSHQTLSWHELGRAVDFRKRTPEGLGDPTTNDEDFFRALYDEATAAGCRSLAFHEDGSKFLIHTLHGSVWDAGHCEDRGDYLSLDEAVRAEAPELLA